MSRMPSRAPLAVSLAASRMPCEADDALLMV
jgi:hypothetical protein